MRNLILQTFTLLLLLLYSSCNWTDTVTSNSFTVIPEFQKNSAQPFLSQMADGRLLLSWQVKKEDTSELFFAELTEGGWSKPEKIASGKRWFTNWADYPTIVKNKDQLLAHYLKYSDTGKYTYNIQLVSLNPKKEIILHDDGKKAEHGFVSKVAYGDNFFVSWLDGRNTAGGHDHADHGMNGNAMTLRAAVLNKNLQKLNEWELDSRVCDCCQTSAAITSDGPIVVYRNRDENEIRDISIIKFKNGKWLTPVTFSNDNWKIAGCPVNGPQVAAKGNRVAVAWFSAPSDSANVKLIFSENGGESFGTPVLIDSSKPVGRVDITFINEKNVLLSWMAKNEIKAVKVSIDGKVGSPVSIANTNGKRAAGFPQIGIFNENVLVAYTNDSTKKVELIYKPLMSF